MDISNKLVIAGVEPIEHEGVDYYLAEDVVKHAPVYFRRITTRIRDIVNKGMVKSGEYLYISHDKKNDEYIVRPSTYNRAKLYLSEHFLKQVRELNISDTPIVDVDGVEKAPDILYIDDKDKFKDEEGRPLDIEMRGTRTSKGCYFRVSDVAKAFKLDRLHDHILDKHTKYEIGKHYKYFTVENPQILGISDNRNQKIQKALFLTWRGMTKVLYTSHGGIADRFQEWGDEILFVAHMGDDIQRKTLASSIELSIDAKNALDVPVLYLIKIAEVGKVRDKMTISPAIPDNACVYKFGRAEKFQTRFEQHEDDLEYIALGQRHSLSHATNVPEWDLVQAEKDLRALVYPRFGQKYNNKLELITLTDDELKEVKNMYEQVASKYTAILSDKSTCILELTHQVESLKRDVECLTARLADKDELIQLYKQQRVS